MLKKQNISKQRLENLKWEIHKVRNWLVEGRVIYAHRHAKSIIGQYPELESIERSNQLHRIVSRIRHGEIIDAHNDVQSLLDYIARLLELPEEAK